MTERRPDAAKVEGVSQDILALCAACGWGNRELADALGTCPRTVGSWINGERLPRPSFLKELDKLCRERDVAAPTIRAAAAARARKAMKKRRKRRKNGPVQHGPRSHDGPCVIFNERAGECVMRIVDMGRAKIPGEPGEPWTEIELTGEQTAALQRLTTLCCDCERPIRSCPFVGLQRELPEGARFYTFPSRQGALIYKMIECPLFLPPEGRSGPPDQWGKFRQIMKTRENRR